ncbi:reverse transcriptase [Gossypium australe]|uniref:Reverse transcriptase n=1 Tax=Gossypium australe TaxID=47621 RepID=A0A5B6X709_9ROSI|nr:reverse transcriptase [Gossypium australe]
MKFLSWNCRGMGSPATIREFRQLLVANRPNIIFLCETKMSRSGGLALMWKEELDVAIQSYSKHHIDSIVKFRDSSTIRVTGFYGHANPNERINS